VSEKFVQLPGEKKKKKKKEYCILENRDEAESCSDSEKMKTKLMS
jgi:hypothetical protein